MIISLRGTNGAGKSTIVRKIMNLFQTELAMYEAGRKKPLGQVLAHPKKDSDGPGIMVPGHYLIQNGGVDTLPSLDKAYELIRTADDKGVNVLYEGKNMSDGAGRLIALKDEGRRVAAVCIKISDKDALAAVRQRGHKIKAETIKKLNEKTTREVETFKKAGVPVFYLGRAAALKKVRELLGV